MTHVLHVQARTHAPFEAQSAALSGATFAPVSSGLSATALADRMARKVERHSPVIAVTHDHRMIEGFDTVCHLDDGLLTRVVRSTRAHLTS